MRYERENKPKNASGDHELLDFLVLSVILLFYVDDNLHPRLFKKLSLGSLTFNHFSRMKQLPS